MALLRTELEVAECNQDVSPTVPEVHWNRSKIGGMKSFRSGREATDSLISNIVVE